MGFGEVDSHHLADLAYAAKRIADALEKLIVLKEAEREEPTPASAVVRTPFPWALISTRNRSAVCRHVKREKEIGNKRYASLVWPLMCEDLIELGRDELREVYMLGPKGLQSINEQLQKLGMQTL